MKYAARASAVKNAIVANEVQGGLGGGGFELLREEVAALREALGSSEAAVAHKDAELAEAEAFVTGMHAEVDGLRGMVGALQAELQARDKLPQAPSPRGARRRRLSNARSESHSCGSDDRENSREDARGSISGFGERESAALAATKAAAAEAEREAAKAARERDEAAGTLAMLLAAHAKGEGNEALLALRLGNVRTLEGTAAAPWADGRGAQGTGGGERDGAARSGGGGGVDASLWRFDGGGRGEGGGGGGGKGEGTVVQDTFAAESAAAAGAGLKAANDALELEVGPSRGQTQACVPHTIGRDRPLLGCAAAADGGGGAEAPRESAAGVRAQGRGLPRARGAPRGTPRGTPRRQGRGGSKSDPRRRRCQRPPRRRSGRRVGRVLPAARAGQPAAAAQRCSWLHA